MATWQMYNVEPAGWYSAWASRFEWNEYLSRWTDLYLSMVKEDAVY